MLLVTPIEFSLISSANAAKTGSSCKKLNATSTDGVNPLICKKNSKGKSIWVIDMKELELSKRDRLIALNSLKETRSLVADLEKALISAQNGYFENFCKGGGFLKAADIWKTNIERLERSIEKAITSTEDFLLIYPDLKSYAPSQAPKTIFGVCPSTTIQKRSSPAATPAANNYVITITLMKIGDTLPSTDTRAVSYCNEGGYKYKDLRSSAGVEIRDGNGNLVAVGVLGSATVIDVPGQRLSTCSFKSVFQVKKADFYQVKIGTRFNQSFSFADLEMKNWEIELSIISYAN